MNKRSNRASILIIVLGIISFYAEAWSSAPYEPEDLIERYSFSEEEAQEHSRLFLSILDGREILTAEDQIKYPSLIDSPLFLSAQEYAHVTSPVFCNMLLHEYIDTPQNKKERIRSVRLSRAISKCTSETSQMQIMTLLEGDLYDQAKMPIVISLFESGLPESMKLVDNYIARGLTKRDTYDAVQNIETESNDRSLTEVMWFAALRSPTLLPSFIATFQKIIDESTHLSDEYLKQVLNAYRFASDDEISAHLRQIKALASASLCQRSPKYCAAVLNRSKKDEL